MRADRLVSLLMILQRHGKVSARQLACQLEVSMRTIYRDMDALSAAGISVYTERGVEGGCCLVEDYRTDLTGLIQDEAHALFLLTAPGPLDEMAVGQKLQAALRKLFASLPVTTRGAVDASPRLHLDWMGWKPVPASPAPLELLYQAVVGSRRVALAYRLWNGILIEQVVDPLGLVAKAGEWHLVYRAQGKINRRRLARLESVNLLPDSFDYPPQFNLAQYWQGVVLEADAEGYAYRVRLRTTRSTWDRLSRRFGKNAVELVSENPDHNELMPRSPSQCSRRRANSCCRWAGQSRCWRRRRSG